MRLLILTQKVDKEDLVLGFFHKWIREFALRCEQVTVVCLEKGPNELPENVKVLSLGKEVKESRLQYAWRFYKYIWQERGNYDAVFVHMNQEYVLLGGLLWKMWGKEVFLWRLHPIGNFATRIAALLSKKVFTSTRQAYAYRFKNAALVPVGIDLERFIPAPLPVEGNMILSFGRIAPIKKIDQLIDGLKALRKKKVVFKADIVGDALPKDEWYYESLKEKIRKLGLTKYVRMLPGVNLDEAPKLLQEYKLFVNLTPDGSLDKTILEALSAGLKVVVANSHFKDVLPENWFIEHPDDAESLAHNIKMTLGDSHSRNTETQARISHLLEEHRLEKVIGLLVEEMSNMNE